MIAASLLALAGAWYRWGPPPSPALLLVLALGVTIGEVRAVRLPAGEAVSTGAVMALAAVWLLPPAGAGLVEIAGWVLAGLYRRRLSRVTLFNAAQTALAAVAAGAVYVTIGGDAGGSAPAAYLLAATTFLVVNSGLVGAAIALQRAEPLLPAITAIYRSHLVRGLVFTVVSIPVAVAGARWGALALVGYTIVTLGLERLLVWMRARELDRLENEVTHLLTRPGVTGPAAERLVRSVEAFGRDLGLPEPELRDLRFAALLSGAALEDAAAGPGLRRAVAMAGIHRILAGRRTLLERGLPPDGPEREAIPRGAHILVILEAFAALIGGHGPRGPGGLRAALKMLENLRGVRLDPTLTGRFIDFVLEHEGEVRAWLAGMPAGSPGRIQQLARGLRDLLAEVVEAPAPRRSPGRAGAGLTDHGLALQLNLLLEDDLSPGQVYARIADILARAVGEPCWVFSESDWGTFRLEAGHGILPAGSRLVQGSGPLLRAVTRLASAQGRVDAGQRPWSDLLPPGRWHLLAVPLVARGRVTGVLAAARPPAAPFTAGERELIEAVAGVAAMAVENVTLREDTRRHLSQVASLKRFTDHILDQMPVAMVAFGADGQVRLINRTARQLLTELGLDPGRLEWLPLRGWIRLNRRWSVFARALLGREEWHDAAWAVTLHGKRRVFDVYVGPIYDPDGSVVAVVGTARDVTERHRLERQVRESERLAAIGQLAAGAAHEIRNPLTAVKGFIQLMREDLPAEHENLDLVLAEIERIERLVDDLLLMARPAELQLGPCDVNRLIEKVATLLRAQARPLGVAIETCLRAGLPEIQADSRQLRQVLFNLGRNAIEAMTGGGILRFETLPGGIDDRPAVIVRVADTGPGIREQDRAQIYEPFYTTKAGGTGLGLAVVQAIIRNHGGTIDAGGGETGGTVFTVRLLVDGPGEGVSTGAAASPTVPHAPKGGER